MEKFDAIVVGAGLAGLACAYKLAQEGLEVLVLERGDYAGAKNVTGGRIYINPVRELFPDLWEKAPFERYIAHEGVVVMAKERSVSFEYSGNELRQPPHQSYSILRAKFDRWLARQAEQKGAIIVTKSLVEDVIVVNEKVAGVRASGDELYADVVIACDGVLSLISEKAGLRKPGLAKNYAVGFKEIIEMDPQMIEERFHLEENEGAARLFLGEVTKGKFGGGFLYTNQSSLSLGIVIGIEGLMEGNPTLEAPQILDDFKQRPEISRLIRGGEIVEYSAHVIPEGGYKALGKLFGNGILVAGDAAGFSMNIGVTVRGMEYAIATGFYAALTVLDAKQRGDYSASVLSQYEKYLNDSFVIKDFKSFQDAPAVLDNPRIYQYYPDLIGNILKDVYAVNGAKDKIYQTVRNHISLRDLFAIAGDARKVMKI
ncbi:MAG: FAD-dependent oxidoreductase [Syntrophomonadaceae bacterium]